MTGCILVPIVGGVIGAGLFWLALAAFKKAVPRSAGGAKLGPEEIAGKIREEARIKAIVSTQQPTHIVSVNGTQHAAIEIGGCFYSKATGENLGHWWKEGFAVIEFLNLTDQQKKDKAALLRLFDKMIRSKRTKAGYEPAGMGAQRRVLRTYSDYMQLGPYLRLWGHTISLSDTDLKCELTTAELRSIEAQLDAHTWPPKMDPKQIEDLL